MAKCANWRGIRKQVFHLGPTILEGPKTALPQRVKRHIYVWALAADFFCPTLPQTSPKHAQRTPPKASRAPTVPLSGPERPRAAWSGPERPRAAQSGPKAAPKWPQSGPEHLRASQSAQERPRAARSGPERPPTALAFLIDKAM